MIMLCSVALTYLMESEDWRVEKDASSLGLPCRFTHAVLNATLEAMFWA